MARMQLIALNGAGATPKVYNLIPQSLVNNLGVWREATGAITERERLTAQVRPAGTGNFGQKVTLRLHTPHPADVDGSCCVDKNATLPESHVTVEFFRHNVAPDAAIADLIAQLQSLVYNADVVKMFEGEGLMG